MRVMRVDEDSLQHVATVARLRLTPEEIRRFLPQLQEMLDTFSKIDEVDTASIEPSFQPILIRNRLREDIATKPFTQEEALSNVTVKKDGYIKGPKAI